jgi:hypothetical protein
MDNLVVSEVFEITGHGIGVFFEKDPTPTLPWRSCHVRVTKPSGEHFETTGHVEFARKVATGEVMALCFPRLKLSQIPIGSQINILGTEAQKDGTNT